MLTSVLSVCVVGNWIWVCVGLRWGLLASVVHAGSLIRTGVRAALDFFVCVVVWRGRI